MRRATREEDFLESSNAEVRLVFAGEILGGFQADEVKRRFGEAFKVQGERLAAMFSGERTVLKRSLSREDAVRYVMQLQNMGVRVHVESLKTPASAAASAPASTPSPAMPAAAVLPAAAQPAVASVPVAATEEEIVCPNCGTRQSKRVFCKECTTDMPRGIAAKKEDADRAREERLEEARLRRGGSASRYAPPSSAGGEVYSGATVEAPPIIGLGFEGRMGRVTYLNAGLLAWVGLAMIGICAAVLLPMSRSWLMFIPLAVAFVLFFIWAIRVTVLRLHDMNRNGWWVLVTLIPYLGWVASLVLMFMPGTSEDNDYGEKPKQGSTAVAIAILVVVIVAGVVATTFATSMIKRGSRGQEAAERIEARSEAAEHVAEYLESPAAQEAFATYAREPNSKAFAASDDGAFGWRSGQGSPRQAAVAAMVACEEHRKPYTKECELVNVNGLWADQRR